jgi:myosin heavy subunit
MRYISQVTIYCKYIICFDRLRCFSVKLQNRARRISKEENMADNKKVIRLQGEYEVLKRESKNLEELVATDILLKKKIEDVKNELHMKKKVIVSLQKRLQDLKDLVNKPKGYEEKEKELEEILRNVKFENLSIEKEVEDTPKAYEDEGQELKNEVRNIIPEYRNMEKEFEDTLEKQVEKPEKDVQSLAGEDVLNPHNENSTEQEDVKQSVSGAAPRPNEADMRSVRTDLQQPAPVAACTTLTGAATDTPSGAPAVPAGRKANR